jgi:hypothetical protein
MMPEKVRYKVDYSYGGASNAWFYFDGTHQEFVEVIALIFSGHWDVYEMRINNLHRPLRETGGDDGTV